MLVTCPECGVEISEEANPCPKCALPNAGRRSKEFNTKYLEEEKKSSEDFSSMEGVQCTNFPTRCDFIGRPYSKLIKIDVAKLEEGVGYGIRYCFECPKCGSLAYRIIVYSSPDYD